MKLKFLGTGTSQGIPVIGSSHPVCLSTDEKDKRLRASAMITTDDDQKILIDCGPDFRTQMLKFNENKVDAVLITHEHNDHIIGLDDLRPLIFKSNKPMPIFCMKRVQQEITDRFPYAFAEEKYPGAPTFDLNIIDDSFILYQEKITPIEVLHYHLPIFGFRFRNCAYITDASYISKTEKEKLKNLDILVLNCLRKTEEHPAHFILPQALELVEELQPEKTYFTHISNRFGFHKEIEKELPENVFLAYDGLEFNF